MVRKLVEKDNTYTQVKVIHVTDILLRILGEMEGDESRPWNSVKTKKKEQRARNGSYRVRARESGERRGNSIF